MLLFKRIFLLIGILPLLACGFEPVYGVDKPVNRLLGNVDIKVYSGRNYFELRDKLIQRLGVSGSDALYLIKYEINVTPKSLTISKDNDVTRYILNGDTDFKIINKLSKKVVYENSISSSVAYSSTAGTHATSIAERDANVRLSWDMADRIVTLLLITVEEWLE